MQVQVIVLVEVDDDQVERPANMTEERHREITAESVRDVAATALNNLDVHFITGVPVLDKTDPFFAT